MTTTATTTDYAAMADFLENLLMRQTERLRSYDLDGAFAIAEQVKPIADQLTQSRALDRSDFAARKQRIQAMYKEICLIIADQRHEVSEKMTQIRQGLKALGGYSGK